MTRLFSKTWPISISKRVRVVFFAGGTGHPYFSTDTGITLRAVEMDADCILLAKSIDGVYDSDPKVNPDAKRYDTISIQEVIDKQLAVVDLTASIMCMEHKMPMAVFDLNEKTDIANAMQGKINGTIVTRITTGGSYAGKLSFMRDKMNKSLEALQNEYGSIRAKPIANPHVLDKLKVDYYGTPTPLPAGR